MRLRLDTALFAALHVAAALALVEGTLHLLVFLGFFLLYGFCVGGGYHRLFAHRAYQLSPVAKAVVAWIGTAALFHGPLWWVSHHRLHHRVADSQADQASPHTVGLWRSYLGGERRPDRERILIEEVSDLASDAYLNFLERYRFLPALSVAGLAVLVGGLAGLLWAYVLPSVCVVHGLCWINSFSHVYGARHHPTPDQSTNNLFISIFTLGEGWHNNHHADPSKVRFGRGSAQPDLVYWMIRALQSFGLAHSLREMRDETA